MKPPPYTRNETRWRALDTAVLRLRRADLSALPALDRVYIQMQTCRDRAGGALAAAYGVQTIAAAYADFRDAQTWVARMRADAAAMPLLCEREQLVICGAIVSAAVIIDTTGFDSPEVAASLERGLCLLEQSIGDDAGNDVLAVARALLEYCEQQGQPDLFHRVTHAVERYLASDALEPLIAGRYLVYQARCRFRLTAYDPTRLADVEALALLEEAEAIGARASLPQLQFDVRYARVLLAAIRNETTSMQALVDRMHDVLDYTRPNCVALYHQHLSRVHLMHNRVAPAFEASSHALRAARLAACVSGEERSYQIMHALALLASGKAERAASEIESMLPNVSGRPRAILECTLGFAEARGARGRRDYRDRLARAMQQAQELNWPLFLNSLPYIAAQLVADSLQFGIVEELARRAISLRKLTPPSDADDRWPWPMRIHTFGRFAVFIDDKPLAFSGKSQRKPLELLKLAIVFGGRGIDSAKASAELWPDLEGDASRNAFDLALHRLRKLLRHDDVMLMREGKLTIDAKRMWVDAWAFESACAEAENPAAASGADVLGRQLLRYYAGTFLGDEDAHWALAMRERLRSKLLRSVSILGQRLEQDAERDEAILLYRRALEVDPLAEEFYRRLMLCYRAQDRIAEALDVYRRCRDLISITLGIEPSAATRSVYKSLKQQS